ncbi:MAG: DUF6171 family protein [Lachnospiraceae bacterium]|nr:DUF6171 family protein [Lachnospiraceae bacterium]
MGNTEAAEYSGKSTLDESSRGPLDVKEPRRFCRKCLTRDMGETEYFRNLHEYIENLDEDLKVSETVYERRLALCKECEKLLQGMCSICGCYVELRAIMKKNRCPLVKARWEREKEMEE